MNKTAPTDVSGLVEEIDRLKAVVDSMQSGPEPKEAYDLFPVSKAEGIQCHIESEVIVRTDSDGVWFGLLRQKAGEEVILDQARMLWRWQAVKGVGLSGVARHGIDPDESKICGPVDGKWCKAIGILEPTAFAASTIRNAKETNA